MIEREKQRESDREKERERERDITYRWMNLEKSPLRKLVLGLCSQTQTPPSPRTATQLDPIVTIIT